MSDCKFLHSREFQKRLQWCSVLNTLLRYDCGLDLLPILCLEIFSNLVKKKSRVKSFQKIWRLLRWIQTRKSLLSKIRHCFHHSQIYNSLDLCLHWLQCLGKFAILVLHPDQHAAMVNWHCIIIHCMAHTIHKKCYQLSGGCERNMCAVLHISALLLHWVGQSNRTLRDGWCYEVYTDLQRDVQFYRTSLCIDEIRQIEM